MDWLSIKSSILQELHMKGYYVPCKIEIRGYNKNIRGLFDFKKALMVIYITDSKGVLLPCSEILDIVAHELTHCYQYYNNAPIYKGIHHNLDFLKKYQSIKRRLLLNA